MTASIVLTGLAANDPVPGVYQEINFAAGPSTGYGGVRAILCLANGTTAGTATRDTVVYGPDTTVPLQTEQDMINLFGTGSEGHRMYRRIAATGNNVTPVYWICVTSSTGAAATGTITVASTATANATLRVFVGDTFIDTAITSGDTPTVIAGNVVSSVNSQTVWPVTASNTAGVVTLTAKVPGLRGNQIRYMAQVIFSSTSPTTTVTATTDTALSGGTTADSNATALATINAAKYYRIVSAAEDATQLGNLASQVLTQALPTTGIRQRVFGGSIDTLSNAQTIATGINSARCEMTWLQTATWTPAELAANAAAVYALFEDSGNKPRNNYSGFPILSSDQAAWKVPAPRLTANAPSRASLKSALLNGLTPLQVNSNGTTAICKRITTRSLTGGVSDYRIRDAHKVTICDFFADDLGTKIALQFGGKDLADDPPQGTPPPGPQVITPRIVKGAVLRLIQDYGDNGLLQNVATIQAQTIVQRELNPRTRVSASIPLQTVDIADQFALSENQVA
jgi:phage tail sheath gpL-like